MTIANYAHNNGPIFVVGPARSGTHLLRFCLSQHSSIFVAPETAFFIKIYGNRRLDPKVFSEGRTDMLVDSIISGSGDPSMHDWERHSFSLKKAVQGAQNYRDFADRFFGKMAGIEGKKRWGEKTPLHAHYIPQILKVFPNARVLFMMRGAKNTIASTLTSGHVRWDIYTALAHFIDCQSQQARLVRRPEVMAIDYEALTAEPEPQLRAICDFLGESFEIAMLRPGMRDSSYSDEIMTRDETISINPDDPEKWCRGLSLDQGALVDQVVARRGQVLHPMLLMARAKLAIRLQKNKAGYYHLLRDRDVRYSK